VTNGDDRRKDLAWAYYLQGYRLHWEMTRESNRLARDMFSRATEIRPDFARAYAHLSLTLIIAWLNGWDSTVSLETIDSAAQTAVHIDGEDYDNLWSRALAHLYSKNFDEAFVFYNRARDAAESQGAPPINLAALDIDRADALLFAGEPEAQAVQDAIRLATNAIRVNESPRWFHWTLGWAHYEAGYFGNEQTNSQRAIEELSRFRRPDTLVTKNLIAAYAANGQVEEAQRLGRGFLGNNQGYTTGLEDRWPYRNPKRLERFKGHLRQAELP
jgi:hypothetical protein